MAPFPKSEISLGIPLYDCDFDPSDSNRLVVGGGGGAGRNGVGNKITVLETENDTIQVTGEISLSKDEDSPNTLVVGQRRNSRSTLIYAGINSEEKKGQNEHFRVFSLDEPSKTKSMLGPKLSELCRSSLFTTEGTDTYQRLLRLSRSFSGSPQLGAVATGLAAKAQIAIFDVSTGSNVAPKLRGVLDLTKEAVDLDIIPTGADKYQLVYSDGYDVYTVDVTKGSNADPVHIYSMPTDDSAEIRPSLRCIRYLSSQFAIAVGNLPQSKGSVLYGFRLPKPGQGAARARMAVSVKMPNAKPKATGLAVANLSPVNSPGTKQGDTEFVIAVARNDLSVSLYTLQHKSSGTVDMIANLYPLRVLKEVHRSGITGLSFSHFTPPSKSTSRLQYLKFASTSVAGTVVNVSIPLKKFIDSSTPVRRGGPPRLPRYVVAAKSQGPSITGMLTFTAIVLVLVGVLLQGWLEIKGLAQPTVGGHKFYPTSWHSVPASREPITPGGFLAKLLAEKKLIQGENIVVLSEEPGSVNDLNSDELPPLRIDLHDENMHDGARKWEDLPRAQQKLWKARLKKSGQWVEGMGETIFKGILFSEIAGAVGAVVGG